VLVLPRTEEGAPEARWVEQLCARGTHAELVRSGGYAGMMHEDPRQAVVPAGALDAVVEWIGQTPRARPSGLYASASASTSRVGRERAQPAVLAVSAPDGRRRTLPLTETPLRFGEHGRLFGIVTRADASRGRGESAARPAVLLLNAGADHHVGPHRMNVDLARELAALGYLALRFDASGLGDSAPAPGKAENRIYTVDHVADVRSAMDVVGALHGTRRFVLVGLCSGAFTAFHTTAADPRVVGQVLISPFAFEWKEGDAVAPTARAGYASTQSYLRMLLERGVWERALRGDVNLRGIAGAVLRRVRTRRRARNVVERAFVAMCERGVESLVVCAFEDGGLDTIGRYLGTNARRMRRHPRFVLEIVEDADHTFTSLISQASLYRMVTCHLRAHFP
jgi:hypothetical protein